MGRGCVRGGRGRRRRGLLGRDELTKCHWMGREDGRGETWEGARLVSIGGRVGGERGDAPMSSSGRSPILNTVDRMTRGSFLRIELRLF